MRQRKFTPESFFLSIIHLVSGTNNQGYQSALLKTFNDLGQLLNSPVKSSLCKYRKKISFLFFKDKFNELVSKAFAYRKTFRGYYVYAIDGQETPIALSKELIDLGFKGRAREHDKETHYPRLYLSHLFDVVNEFTVGVIPSAERNEHRDALELLENTEVNSIVLYDRAYISKALIEVHKNKGNNFIFRCRSGATFKEIVNFYNSEDQAVTWNYLGLKIRLIKLINPKSKETVLLATNLCEKQFLDKEVGQLYLRRWGIETSFKDSVTQALNQWHTKSGNGLLQEFYAHFWLMNFARLQVLMEKDTSTEKWLDCEYEKSNLKLLIEHIVLNIKLILKGHYKKFRRQIKRLLNMTKSKRKHHERSYERILKCSRKTFPIKNLVERRA